MINKKTIAVLVILLAAGAFIVPRLLDSGGSETTFRTAEADRGDVVSLVASNGTVNPLLTIDVSSRVAGTVSAVNVDFNDRVSAGDPLAEIDPSLLRNGAQEGRGRHQKRPRPNSTWRTRSTRATRSSTRSASSQRGIRRFPIEIHDGPRRLRAGQGSAGHCKDERRGLCHKGADRRHSPFEERRSGRVRHGGRENPLRHIERPRRDEDRRQG